MPSSPDTSPGSLKVLDTRSHSGDKGYIGLVMITPTRKPAHGELTDASRRNNTAINRIRHPVEQVIAHPQDLACSSPQPPARPCDTNHPDKHGAVLTRHDPSPRAASPSVKNIVNSTRSSLRGLPATMDPRLEDPFHGDTRSGFEFPTPQRARITATQTCKGHGSWFQFLNHLQGCVQEKRIRSECSNFPGKQQ